jgi:DnaJ-class molecular chaperone
MTAPMQTLPATTDTSAERPCFWCNGSGRVPNDQEQRYDTCRACEGTGTAMVPELGERIAA